MSCLIVCKKCNAVVVRGFDGSQADAGTTEYNVNGCKMHAKTVVLNSGKDSGVQGIFCWKCDGMLGLRFPENFPPVENVVLCDLDEPNMVVFAQNTSIVRRERRGPNPDAPVSTGFFAQVSQIARSLGISSHADAPSGPRRSGTSRTAASRRSRSAWPIRRTASRSRRSLTSS